MSGWIKLEKDRRDDPRVIRMARELRNAGVTHERFTSAVHVTLVLGALDQLWIYADTHIREDDTLDLGADEIDELIGVAGFTKLMPTDWLEIVDEKSVRLPGFQRHNGMEARRKALTQKRVERHRIAAALQTDADMKRTSVTPALPDLDQTRLRPRPKKRATQAPPPIIFPIGLDAIAWQRWVDYRKQRKPPIKPESMQAAVDDFVKYGSDQAAVVQQSIAAGYQGLVPLKGVNGSAQHRPFVAPPDDPEEADHAQR